MELLELLKKNSVPSSLGENSALKSDTFTGTSMIHNAVVKIAPEHFVKCEACIFLIRSRDGVKPTIKIT